MYFPIGWPKYFSSKDVHCGELKSLKYSRDRSLLAVVSDHSVCIWNNRPRVLVVSYRRSYDAIKDVGRNVTVVWKPDSTALAVTTSEGKIVFLELQRNTGVQLYVPRFSRGHSSLVSQNGVPALKLVEIAIVPVSGGVTSVAPRRDQLFVSTGSGLFQRINWNGLLEGEMTMSVHSIPFTNDLENARAIPLKTEGISFRAMDYSPLLGGFAVVLADGRGGFLSAETANFDCPDIIGLWAKDLSSATCVTINHRYRLLAYGCTNGECLVYGFDDLSGALQLSHKLVLSSKDYPDTIQTTGGVQCLSWTPDGCAIAVAWSWTCHGGLAVWSVFGSLLMCTLGGDYGTSQEAVLHNPLHIKAMGWGPEGYNLVMLSEEEESGVEGDIMQLQFVKSALTVNPCMSNHEHLFFQGEQCLYLNTGDMVSETKGLMDSTGATPANNGSVGHSTLVSNKQWIVIQVPSNYLDCNWPIRYAAVDKSGRCLAIAGRTGMAHYSLNSRKWKLFGNVSQEQGFSCRGGLAWWRDFLIVPCYNFSLSSDEVRFYPRTCNLDNAFALNVKLPAPAFLVNVFRCLLLVYCSDSRVVFFSLERADSYPNVPEVHVSRIQEVSLVNHVPHPLAVVHVTLTSLYAEYEGSEGLDGVESLIINVGGRLLMLQKDKAHPERRTRKCSFCLPVVLASCVENVWTSSTSSRTKRHLMEALWLGCGANGMKVWLPLFPGDDEYPPNFLSKRIMLPFQLNIYPLAVLFQDGVILGAANEPMPMECSSPTPTSLSPQAFPFCTLERTTQIYLHHILRQLLRRNLGQQALKIANMCCDLPYFPHVLELMLHEVLEEEATASEPIPDALLPRIVRFIKEFPQYLDTVVHCARKTEVALWGYLFTAVGNPRELFTECLAAGKLETAASYLIILQNLEQPAVSKQHATILLDKALESCRWTIARDLIRFLRCIAADDLESPPRSPTFIKSHHNPNLSPSATVNSDDVSYLVNTHPRSVSASSRGSLTRGNSLDKGSLTRNGSTDKLGSLSRSGSDKARKSLIPISPTLTSPLKRPTEPETPDNFFIDTILNRHARLLLTANRLRDLGQFSAYLEFALVPWLCKERNRAARVDDYIETLQSIHKNFNLPYPAVNQISSSIPFSPKAYRQGRFSSISSSNSTAGGRQTLDELEGRFELGIELGEEMEEEEAHVSPAYRNEDPGRVSGDPSETSSVAYSMDGDEDWVWGAEGPGFVDVQELRAQLAFSGSLQALKEIRFLLQMFVEAKCHDWWIILSLVLRDSTCLTDLIDDVIKLHDTSAESLSRVKSGLELLEAWAEQNCHGYYLFFGLHKEHWLALDKTLTDAKTAPKEQRDSSPSSDSSHASHSTNTSKDEERSGDEQEQNVDTSEEDREEYECVMS
ncbi:guanine nucleotide exchange factor subunit RIC1-like [Acropora millepora]|uniref:guanine nucleotide exchange factor subunit RIC1-like n=1 Tax=Acropora millepora TaxID=45264 RepID=UPI001CF4FFAC|nr:guanine nucleotide exchange factor subunit RIC1-like [Acropora millepora]